VHINIHMCFIWYACCRVVVRHVEDIPFERIRPAKATAQEKKFTDMHLQTFASAVCLQCGMSRTAPWSVSRI
jgi:hypothetical protein